MKDNNSNNIFVYVAIFIVLAGLVRSCSSSNTNPYNSVDRFDDPR